MILVPLDIEGEIFSRSYALLSGQLNTSLGKNGREEDRDIWKK